MTPAPFVLQDSAGPRQIVCDLPMTRREPAEEAGTSNCLKSVTIYDVTPVSCGFSRSAFVCKFQYNKTLHGALADRSIGLWKYRRFKKSVLYNYATKERACLFENIDS